MHARVDAGAFSRPDPAPADHRPKDDDVYVPGGGGEGGYGPRGPCYDPLIPGHGGGLIPIRPDLPAPGYGRGRYPCFRPLPYHPTPPLPPPQNGDTPPPWSSMAGRRDDDLTRPNAPYKLPLHPKKSSIVAMNLNTYVSRFVVRNWLCMGRISIRVYVCIYLYMSRARMYVRTYIRWPLAGTRTYTCY